MENLDRTVVRLTHGFDDDDGFVDASPGERMGMVWELTRNAWAFMGRDDAERPLQRDVVRLIRRGS